MVATPAASSLQQTSTELLIKNRTEDVTSLAALFGLTDLRVITTGRLVAKVPQDRDALDVAQFEVELAELLGVCVEVFNDDVLANANVSPDIFAAAKL